MDNGHLRTKVSREWAKSRKGEGATGLGRRTRKEIIEKWDQTDSPGIPDTGKT